MNSYSDLEEDTIANFYFTEYGILPCEVKKKKELRFSWKKQVEFKRTFKSFKMFVSMQLFFVNYIIMLK